MNQDHHGTVSALLALLERFAGLHVWVVGDVMLDEYVTGAVERISPEAPVPVVRAQATEHRLGGAANVARQLAAVGARVSLGGLIGADEAGETLTSLCANDRIDTRALLSVAMDQRKRSGDESALTSALSLAKSEVSYFQGRVEQAKRAKNTEAAVNLGISTKRLLSAIEEAEKLQS